MNNIKQESTSLQDHYRKMYDGEAHTYDESRFGTKRSNVARHVKNDLIIDIIKQEGLLKPEIKIIDIATGTGRIIHQLAKENFKQLSAVDISPEMIKVNKKNIAPEDRQKVSYYEADMKNLPFNDNSFDVVTIGSFFYLIPASEYASFTADIYRILRPKGILICEVSNTLAIMNPKNFLWILNHKFIKKRKIKSYITYKEAENLFGDFKLSGVYGTEYPMLFSTYTHHQKICNWLSKGPITARTGGKLILVLKNEK